MDTQSQRKTPRSTKCTTTTTTSQDNETVVDRISSLPDGLIHHILSFSDAQLAVQTSSLSKRWKLVWTTLPFLNFSWFGNLSSFISKIKFIDNVLSRRNHDFDVLKLNLCFHSPPEYSTPLIGQCLQYAISHNVQDLNVDVPGVVDLDDFGYLRLNYLTSNTIKKLVLKLNIGEFLQVLYCSWHLPALTTLHLILPDYEKPYKLPEIYLVCLPSLKTLLLDGFELPNSISLPFLQTLILHTVEFPENMSEFSQVFQALANLRNLTLFFWTTLRADCVIDCPQLVNLKISYCRSKTGKRIVTSNSGKIMVLAPKIRNFSSVGFFPIKFGVPRLENVSIQLPDSAGIKTVAPSKPKEIFYYQVTDMFMELSGAKILTLDLKTIEALSAHLDILVSCPFYSFPFLHLKHVKVPHGFKESSMSTYLKWYLLKSSPQATIVTTLPQKNMIPRTKATSATAQNVVQRDPLAASTKASVGSKKLHKTVCVDTLDKVVQEEHMVQNSVVNAVRVTQIGVPVEGTGNHQVSSSSGYSKFGLWRGHEVNSEFVCLLDLIMNKYPETFEPFTTKNKKVCTMKLNTLCTSVNDFSKISMTDVDTEVIAEYRDVFVGLQKFGFNVSWLERRLNYIEQLRFSEPLLPELHAIDCHINDAISQLQDLETKLQDLRSLRAEKMEEIHKAFGTTGANLAVGYIGNDLFSGP